MRVRRTLAALLAAPFLLSACGGGGSSVADPPMSSAPLTSAPTQAPAHESPEHFIRRWAAEDTRIQQTGKTSAFRAMSRDCRGCIKLADLVDKIYSAGGFVRTAGWRVRLISAAGPHTYDLFVFSARTTYATSRDAAVHHLASGPAHFQLKLDPAGSGWRVSSLVQIA